ncbi:hypothetical protein J2129_002391 [Methanofollis sp. W23]|nr:hypothetical protein [Methanofollis sp. W23]
MTSIAWSVRFFLSRSSGFSAVFPREQRRSPVRLVTIRADPATMTERTILSWSLTTAGGMTPSRRRITPARSPAKHLLFECCIISPRPFGMTQDLPLVQIVLLFLRRVCPTGLSDGSAMAGERMKISMVR